MTLAQNHLQQLSGNKILILCLLLSLISCGSQKSITNKNSNAKSKIETKEFPQEKMDTLDKQIKEPKVKDLSPVLQDTLHKSEGNNKNNAESATTKGKTNESNKFKDKYKILAFVPLDSDDLNDNSIASSRFVQYYAGMLAGLEKLDNEGYSLSIKVIDTEENTLKNGFKIADYITEDLDIVIGPFDRNQLKEAVDLCKEKQVSLVSPWQSSSKLTENNPYYIQIKPNLREHFNKIIKEVLLHNKKGEVAIVGMKNKETKAWIDYFQQEAKLQDPTIQNDFFIPYFVGMDSLTNGPTAFHGLLANTKVKTIIFPQYSFTDEHLLYSCLRRLMVEKSGKQISVYGMPILYESDKVEFEYYHALNIKIVMSDFIDQNSYEIANFRRIFLDKYGELPSVEAVKGYDLMLFLGRSLGDYGKGFQNDILDKETSYIQTKFNIQKAVSENRLDTLTNEDFDYFENRHLDIIEFKGNKFQIVINN